MSGKFLIAAALAAEGLAEGGALALDVLPQPMHLLPLERHLRLELLDLLAPLHPLVPREDLMVPSVEGEVELAPLSVMHLARRLADLRSELA